MTIWAFRPQWVKLNSCAGSIRLCNPFLMSLNIYSTFSAQTTYSIYFARHLVSQNCRSPGWFTAQSRTDYQEVKSLYHLIRLLVCKILSNPILIGRWTAKLILDAEDNRWSAPRWKKIKKSLLCVVWFGLKWWQLVFWLAAHWILDCVISVSTKYPCSPSNLLHGNLRVFIRTQ